MFKTYGGKQIKTAEIKKSIKIYIWIKTNYWLVMGNMYLFKWERIHKRETHKCYKSGKFVSLKLFFNSHFNEYFPAYKRNKKNFIHIIALEIHAAG